jgi:pimeloyl-ACP methyl ester carboxylesterase
MRHKVPQPAESLVIPVAGAANAGHGWASTAELHFLVLDAALRSHRHKVTHPIVPSGLGLFHKLEEIYSAFSAEVGKTLDHHPEAKDVVFVGHSLGGLLGRRYLSDHLSSDRHLGVIAIGTPHDGLSRFVPRRWKDSYEDFAGSIGELSPPTQAFVGSAMDELVPVRSSLADIPAAQRFHFGLTRHRDERVTSFVHLTPLPHNLLPVAPSVVRLTSRLVDDMVAHGLPDRSSVAA